MKTTFFLMTTTIILISASSGFTGDMDLILRQVARHTSQGNVLPDLEAGTAPWSKLVTLHEGEVLIPCIMKTTDPDSTIRAIEEAGGRATKITQEIITARVLPDSVEKIVSRDEVVFAEASTLLGSKMDTARAATGVDGVQSGSALGQAYDGTNVVVGLVDDGLDYGNPDFHASNGVTRVQYLMQSSGGTTTECTKRTIANETCGLSDGGGGTFHGTHVTGIAAGSDATYKGVAPNADIMFVVNTATDTNTSGTGSLSLATVVLEGAQKIFEKADAIDKPAVINLSLGTSLGAHDGTSLLEDGLSQLTAAKGGRIIVNAAGNEQVVSLAFSSIQNYIGGIRAGINVTASSGRGHRIIIISGADAVSSTGSAVVDLWLDQGQKSNCSVAVFGYTNGRSSADLTFDFTFSGLSSTANASLATGDVSFSSDTTSPVSATGASVTASIEIDAEDTRNSKSHAMISIAPVSGASSSKLEQLWFDVVVRASSGGACTGHMWLYPDYTLFHDFLKNISTGAFDVATGGNGAGYVLSDGDSFYTTTIPATATGVIAAGSFMPPKPAGASTSKWTGDDGNTYDQSSLSSPGGTGSTTGDVSGFSSLGPTADGRTKPDVVAPGEPIISTKARGASTASSITVGDDHIKKEGTSMASPHVAGIVALLLQRNNTLGVDGVRTALSQGADTTGLTSKTTDAANTYGAGKVNAASALASVAANTSLYKGTGDLETPDTSSGSGALGCSLIR